MSIKQEIALRFGKAKEVLLQGFRIGGGSMQGSPSWDEKYVTTDLFNEAAFDNYLNRTQRYRLLWAFYEATPYSEAHNFTDQYKEVHQLYKHTRAVYNPANRIGEFFAMRVMGGHLDRKAGDGKQVPSALPIICDNQAIRGALENIWRWSNWKVLRTTWVRFGCVLGDVGLKVVDNPDKQRVYFEVVKPNWIKYIGRDAVGNINAYMIEKVVDDPLFIQADNPGVSPPAAIYTETCQKIRGQVIYATYYNGEPFDWRIYDYGDMRIGPVWTVPYTFVPFVVSQNINVGLNYGWSEWHAGLSKMREVDDLGSTTTDQARKVLNGPWIINTQKPDKRTKSNARPNPAGDEWSNETEDNANRGDQSIMYIDKDNLKVVPMIGDMPIADVVVHTQNIRDELERHFPELLACRPPESGDASGRALRVARQLAEAKVVSRRSDVYDDDLCRAHMMAITIGGIQGYKGFESFGADSYDDGNLFHEIGPRPVFSIDPLDDIEEQKEFWNAGLTASQAGYPLICYLKDAGWDDERIAAVEAQMKKDKQALIDAQRFSGSQPGGNQANAKGSAIFPPTNAETQSYNGKSNGNVA